MQKVEQNYMWNWRYQEESKISKQSNKNCKENRRAEEKWSRGLQLASEGPLALDKNRFRRNANKAPIVRLSNN